MKKNKKKIIYKKVLKKQNPVHSHIKNVLRGVLFCSLLAFIFSALLTAKTVTREEMLVMKSQQVLGANTLSSFLSDSEATAAAYPLMPTFLTPNKATISATPNVPVASLSAAPSPSYTPTPTPSIATQVSTNASNFCVNVPVLLYHHVEPMDLAVQQGHGQLTVDSSIFDGQMAYLVTNGYHVISADELVSAIIAHTGLPPKTVLVTLDDGYVDAYTYAFPIFKKYNIIGNLMIPAGLLMNPDYLTWDQLKEMAKSPVIKIYNHTWSHADLANSDHEKIETEITDSQNALQMQLGTKINIFTYPYGSFSPLVIDILREHGFVAAFSTLGGTTQCESNLMTLYRIHIGNAPMSAYGF